MKLNIFAFALSSILACHAHATSECFNDECDSDRSLLIQTGASRTSSKDYLAKNHGSKMRLRLSDLAGPIGNRQIDWTTRKRRAQQDPRKLVFIGYLSAPANVARRKQVRDNCFPLIQAAGYEAKFFIGRPNEIGPPILSSQGQTSTQLEADLASQLQNESDTWGDIVIVPFRDAYRDLSDKVTVLFRYALQEGFEHILKIDDDHCPNMAEVIPICNQTRPSQARYIGQYMFNGTEYDVMKGRDGTVAKFMSGIGFILSADLAHAIFYDDSVHTLLFAPYGTSSDDANVGKWYDYAAKKHPGLHFSEEEIPNLVTPVVGGA